MHGDVCIKFYDVNVASVFICKSQGFFYSIISNNIYYIHTRIIEQGTPSAGSVCGERLLPGGRAGLLGTGSVWPLLSLAVSSATPDMTPVEKHPGPAEPLGGKQWKEAVGRGPGASMIPTFKKKSEKRMPKG